ncbi:hypothetical protein AKJ16_DCAP23202 [Drosera capensis]
MCHTLCTASSVVMHIMKTGSTESRRRTANSDTLLTSDQARADKLHETPTARNRPHLNHDFTNRNCTCPSFHGRCSESFIASPSPAALRFHRSIYKGSNSPPSPRHLRSHPNKDHPHSEPSGLTPTHITTAI